MHALIIMMHRLVVRLRVRGSGDVVTDDVRGLGRVVVLVLRCATLQIDV
jgi:hypothetical protein